MENYNDDYIFDESLGRYPYSFSLGVKEILFLSMIFFFGFCGFSFCVDKIYAESNEKQIENVTIHQIESQTSESLSHIQLDNCLVQGTPR